MPTANTSSDCWPHLITGFQRAACSPAASIGMNLAPKMIRTAKCRRAIWREVGLVVGIKRFEQSAWKQLLKLWVSARPSSWPPQKEQITQPQDQDYDLERTRNCRGVGAAASASHAPSTKAVAKRRD